MKKVQSGKFKVEKWTALNLIAAALLVAVARIGPMATSRHEERAADGGRQAESRSAGAEDRRRPSGPHGAVGQRVVPRRQGRAAAVSPPGRAARVDVQQRGREDPRRTAVQAVGGRSQKETVRRREPGQPGRELPADGHHAVPRAAAAAQDHPDAGRDRHPLRGQLGHPPDLHGRPAARPNNDPQPWWYGYSAGHWEGDTLVVTTTACATAAGWTSRAAR